MAEAPRDNPRPAPYRSHDDRTHTSGPSGSGSGSGSGYPRSYAQHAAQAPHQQQVRNSALLRYLLLPILPF